jgi:epoxyqueuosine reductase
MKDANEVKKLALQSGADVCGIAPASRFINAPKGFRPNDIYNKCKSVLVFAKRLPTESLFADSCIPYTQLNSIVTQEVDKLSYKISLILQDEKINSVLIPTDDPYEYWEGNNLYGRAILSLRHAGYLSGLGFLGKNTLLINQKYGNMIQIGALLLDQQLKGDMIIDHHCPDSCNLCIDNCPTKALDGITVNQKACRSLSTFKNDKGYIIKKCYECRKICPKTKGEGR